MGIDRIVLVPEPELEPAPVGLELELPYTLHTRHSVDPVHELVPVDTGVAAGLVAVADQAAGDM